MPCSAASNWPRRWREARAEKRGLGLAENFQKPRRACRCVQVRVCVGGATKRCEEEAQSSCGAIKAVRARRKGLLIFAWCLARSRDRQSTRWFRSGAARCTSPRPLPCAAADAVGVQDNMPCRTCFLAGSGHAGTGRWPGTHAAAMMGNGPAHAPHALCCRKRVTRCCRHQHGASTGVRLAPFPLHGGLHACLGSQREQVGAHCCAWVRHTCAHSPGAARRSRAQMQRRSPHSPPLCPCLSNFALFHPLFTNAAPPWRPHASDCSR